MPADVPPKIDVYLVADDEESSDTRKRTIRFGDESQEAATGEKPVRGVDGGEESVPGGPSSLQNKMLAMAGQDLDTFMQEMEVSSDWLTLAQCLTLIGCSLLGGAPGEGGREAG